MTIAKKTRRSSNEPERAVHRSIIGAALVEDGVLNEDQLKRALRIQSLLEQPKQLGEILIDLGYATRKAIAESVARHGGAMRLGDMLVEQGYISPNDLDAALALQREKGIRIGEALVELGVVNERTLLQNLANQSGVAFIEPDFAMVESTLLSGVSPDYLARNAFLPFSQDENGRVTVVVAQLDNATTLQAVNDVYGGNHVLALGPPDALKQAIEDFRRYRAEQKPARGGRMEAEADAVVQLVDHIISRAIEEGASDIHIEPMSDRVRLRYRIDGVLVYKTDLPRELLARITSRIKILAECNITEHQRHQGGRIWMKVGGRDYDLRLSLYVTVHGECVVLRILNKEMGLIGLDELGMNPAMLERYRNDVLDLPTGVVLITGPTGSGKTTTLYSSIDYCNNVNTKVITAEDPVEYMIDGIIQCSISDKIGRTFEATLREMVRQDPDIIVMGEIRDRISAETAIQAALTGHKVYSTFHTEDTIGGLLRLMDMDIETFLISSTVVSVLAQRLLRRICDECAAPHVPTPRELLRLGLEVGEVREYEFRRGRGCKHCSFTGYRGRVGVYELLILNEPIKEAILHKRPSHEIREISIETSGLISMREDAIAKVVRGYTTFDEVLKHTPRTSTMHPLRQVLTMTE